MNWSFADYVILSTSAVAGVAGLFIGFSGALAFLSATVVSALVGKLAWAFSADFFATNWTRGLVTVIVTLLAFGLVRWAVKRVVNGLLKQPADSIFGLLIAAITGILVSAIAVYLLNFFGLADIRSVFVSEAMNFL